MCPSSGTLLRRIGSGRLSTVAGIATALRMTTPGPAIIMVLVLLRSSDDSPPLAIFHVPLLLPLLLSLLRQLLHPLLQILLSYDGPPTDDHLVLIVRQMDRWRRPRLVVVMVLGHHDRRIDLLILMRGIGVDGSASDGPTGFVPGDRAAAAGSTAAPSLGLPMSSFRFPGSVFVVAIISIAIIAIATRLPSPFGGLISGASAIVIIGTVRLQWGCAQPIARAGSTLTIAIATSGCVGSNSGSSCSGIVGIVVLTRILSARSGSSGRHVTCGCLLCRITNRSRRSDTKAT